MARVLVADDNDANRYLLEVLLKGHGHDVISVVNGIEALSAARSYRPDLLITDILMPVMDGFSLCRNWKQNPELSDVPLIIYTATYVDQRDKDLALELGADRFIIKPAEPDEFIAAVDGILGRRGIGDGPGARQATADEMAYLRGHNETLVRKLAQRTERLAQTNEMLERQVAAYVRSQEELRRQKLDLQQVLDSVVAQIWYLDTDAQVVRCNATARQALEAAGVTGDEDRTVSIDQLWDDPALRRRECLEVIRSGNAVVGTVEKINIGDHTRWVSVDKVPWTDAIGRTIGLLLFVYDITARKRAEEALVAKVESERFLLRELDHRVRNNLSALLALVDMSRESSADLEGMAELMCDRIETIATAHSALADRKWNAVPVRHLIESLVPSSLVRKVQCDGPDAMIPPGQVQAVALVVRELIRDSIARGVHKAPNGAIHASWVVDVASTGVVYLKLEWSGVGGSATGAAAQGVADLELITGLVRSELGGTASLDAGADDPVHTLEFMLQELSTARFGSTEPEG